ncbi:hypothetical protein FHS18_004606 [Paenibacillus phyllosphaerae]|uniref:Uncharacterized protein n=1 Tax=Paenibacillus phyllosphaerae TaxID=274593 RepID=A0A7W5B145_9BACL|nr:hypothetical protein [Paenibacillus phyllosphaerae]
MTYIVILSAIIVVSCAVVYFGGVQLIRDDDALVDQHS